MQYSPLKVLISLNAIVNKLVIVYYIYSFFYLL